MSSAERKQIDKLIYCSTVCSEKTYSRLYGNQKEKPLQQAQKYHLVMLHGLSIQNEVPVVAVSKIPAKPESGDQFIKGYTEKINNVDIFYLARKKLPIINSIQNFLAPFRMLRKLATKQSVLIIDVLNYSFVMAAALVCKIKHCQMIGIVTDLPSKMSDNPQKIKIMISEYVFKKCNAYVVLTEDINTEINKWNKPYVVIEGQVDSNMSNATNLLDKKYSEKVCLYSGGLNNANGIMNMVKGFQLANIDNAELHIYGYGDCAEQIEDISKIDTRIKFLGCKMNNEVVEAQQKATLLVNPRPTNQRFVRYSFPSKNMEYMVSGTPMLTTRLPGIPKEYDKYVYYIDDETPEGICKALQTCLEKDCGELHQKGLEAKEFVLTNKSDFVQANKVIMLAKRLFQ